MLRAAELADDRLAEPPTDYLAAWSAAHMLEIRYPRRSAARTLETGQKPALRAALKARLLSEA